MARKVFYSFHFANDFFRTQQVRNMGVIEGQSLCNANAWEDVKRQGPGAIERWIASNMDGTTCVVVLVGAQTASRPWVRHEIGKGWNDGRGVLGIRIDRLLGTDSRPSTPGPDPMAGVSFTGTSLTLAGVAPLKTPAGADSKAVYASISANIGAWIEEAIAIRRNYRG